MSSAKTLRWRGRSGLCPWCLDVSTDEPMWREFNCLRVFQSERFELNTVRRANHRSQVSAHACLCPKYYGINEQARVQACEESVCLMRIRECEGRKISLDLVDAYEETTTQKTTKATASDLLGIWLVFPAHNASSCHESCLPKKILTFNYHRLQQRIN